LTPASLRASSPFAVTAEASVSSETSGHGVMLDTFCVYLMLQLEVAVDRDRVAGFCEHDNEPSGYIQGWEFCASLSDC